MNEWKRHQAPKRCNYCKHWQRNEGFPNLEGICKRPFVPAQSAIFPLALKNAETHGKFGCTGFDYNTD